jgi:cell division initiation protein
VLNLYRNHVESLSRLPEYQKEEAKPAETEEATAVIPEAIDPEAEPAPVSDANEAEAENAEPDFWEKDESELKIDPPPAAEAEDYAAFQGVKFSE